MQNTAALFVLLLTIDALGQTQAAAPTKTADHSSASPEVLHVGGAVLAPRLTFQVDPELSEQARKLHRSAHVQLYILVGPDGVPSHVRLMQSANIGAYTDQRLIDAVKQYRYRPATLDGKPITVDTYVDIDMDVF